MGELLKLETLQALLLYVVPGVVATTFYNLSLPPSKKQDIAGHIIEYITFSMVYLAIFFTVFRFINRPDVESNILLFDFSTILIAFIVPAVLGILVAKLRLSRMVRNQLGKLFVGLSVEPTPTVWDRFFMQKPPICCLVVCHFKSKDTIIGLYDGKSYVAAAPFDPEIYLEEVWEVVHECNHSYLRIKPGTKGAYIKGGDCDYMEFFSVEELPRRGNYHEQEEQTETEEINAIITSAS